MNKNSLSHLYAKNQDSLSWIDDPFDLKGAFTGVVHLSHERNLTDYAENLVSNFGRYQDDLYELSLDMLPSDEQNELVRLYIESIDREIENACYGDDESINSDFLCSLLSMLQNDNSVTRKAFAETTRKNLIVYYTNPLNKLLKKSCDMVQRMQMHHQGYAYEDMKEDEILWGEF